jgi:hypothetical protein
MRWSRPAWCRPDCADSEVTGFVQDDTGVEVRLSDGQVLRAEYLAGCDGGSAKQPPIGPHLLGPHAERLIRHIRIHPPSGGCGQR